MKQIKNADKMYCYDKVAQPNSAIYYSLRALTSVQRDVAVAIHAFYREMEEILFECENYELAQIKFKWWKNEILKLTGDEADHPVMIFLQKNAVNLEKIQNRLLKIVDGFEQNAISSHFETAEDVIVHWMRTAGERELLLNEQIQTDEIISPEIIYQLMLVIEIVNHVQHLRLYLRHNCLYFSTDELQKFSLTQAMFGEYVTTDQIKNLLQSQVEKVERAFSVMKELSSKQRVTLSHLVIRCHIARAVLDEIQKSDFQVLENLILLTPLRYWWIAFRG